MSDELVTALRPYGSDELTISDVNPIGTNWIYNLDYFIQNGDITSPISDKWQAWQGEIAANREYYRGLVCLRATAISSLVAEQTSMLQLKDELDLLVNQQSVII